MIHSSLASTSSSGFPGARRHTKITPGEEARSATQLGVGTPPRGSARKGAAGGSSGFAIGDPVKNASGRSSFVSPALVSGCRPPPVPPPLYVICIPAISPTARMGQQLVGAVGEEIAECKSEKGAGENQCQFAICRKRFTVVLISFRADPNITGSADLASAFRPYPVRVGCERQPTPNFLCFPWLKNRAAH